MLVPSTLCGMIYGKFIGFQQNPVNSCKFPINLQGAWQYKEIWLIAVEDFLTWYTLNVTEVFQNGPSDEDFQ